MPTVADSMRREIKKVSHTTPVTEAASKMSAEKVGSLFVEKKGELVGIVTETDVVRKAVATGAALGNLTVEKIMSSQIATIESYRSNGDASDMMSSATSAKARRVKLSEKVNIMALSWAELFPPAAAKSSPRPDRLPPRAGHPRSTLPP